jgi:hypothetical protein
MSLVTTGKLLPNRHAWSGWLILATTALPSKYRIVGVQAKSGENIQTLFAISLVRHLPCWNR